MYDIARLSRISGENTPSAASAGSGMACTALPAGRPLAHPDRDLPALGGGAPARLRLLYRSPVPGYAAPSDTIEPASRVVELALAILADAATTGMTEPPLPLPPAVAAAVAPVRAIAGPAFTDDLTYRALVAWSGVIGAVTLELFGHLHNGVEDFDTWFTEAMRRLAPLPAGADGLRSRS